MARTKVSSCHRLKLLMLRPYAAEDKTQLKKNTKEIEKLSDTLMQFQWHITARSKIYLSKNENVAYVVGGKPSIFVVT